jgi:hypothetical protein
MRGLTGSFARAGRRLASGYLSSPRGEPAQTMAPMYLCSSAAANAVCELSAEFSAECAPVRVREKAQPDKNPRAATPMAPPSFLVRARLADGEDVYLCSGGIGMQTLTSRVQALKAR